MHTQRLADSPQHVRGGQVSYLLLTKGQFDSQNLAITWVEGEPNSEQLLHAHPLEQVYVIVRGRGLMKVAGEEEEVTAGTLIFVPPDAPHAIRNTGEEPLAYVSATAPPFGPDIVALYQHR
jgi:mannose-6-phosphate isomerase-like protein (cupin superfamily)